MNFGRIIDGAVGAWNFVLAIRDTVRDMRAEKPPLRVDELHVGATTTDAVDRERAAARAKWPDADLEPLPRPPRVPREGGAP